MRSLRLYLAFCVAAVVICSALPVPAETADPLRVATYRCDITPPLGQPMMACDPLRTVEQPLLAKGIVLMAGEQRYVLCAVDWCQLSNGSHLRWRKKIADAAGTDVAHVAVQTVHQHAAPLADMDAQKLLAEVGAANLQLDPRVLDAIEERLAAAVKQSLDHFEPFDQIGTGQAKVDRVASSRRPVDEKGKICPRFARTSDRALQALPEGTIDPYVKTITLARDGKPLVRMHYYATHPQTVYGDGHASSEFVGTARETLEAKEHIFQIYFNGCAGDITVGKYNDGSQKDCEGLAARLLAGMQASVAATKLAPAGRIRWRTCPVLFPPRTDPGFSLADDLARMKDPKKLPVSRTYTGSLRVAFHQRSQQPIELSSLEIGNVHILHLPGEPLIEFQFYAQKLRPAEFVAVAGYGDCCTGYICPKAAYAEGGYEPIDSTVKPECEAILKKAIAALLGVE